MEANMFEVSLTWVTGLVVGIEHMDSDDGKSWMIAIHLLFLRILIEKTTLRTPMG